MRTTSSTLSSLSTLEPLNAFLKQQQLGEPNIPFYQHHHDLQHHQRPDQHQQPPPQVVGERIDETGFTQSIAVSQLLLDTQSPYQRIQVFQAAKPYFGKLLVLDGVLQLAEGDAAAYNEMLAHVALLQHPNPQRVLVIGGGDGHVVTEVLKHPTVTHVDHVDLDETVIRVCQEWFPQWAYRNNPRVQLHITDGAAYCRNYATTLQQQEQEQQEQQQGQSHNQTSNSASSSLSSSSLLLDYYDVIIQDSSDPWTTSDGGRPLPSSVLYTPEHMQNVYQMLDPDHGIFVFQAEMLQIPSDLQGVALWRQSALKAGFTRSRYGSISIGSYPTGQIGFLLCEKTRLLLPLEKDSQILAQDDEEEEEESSNMNTSTTSFAAPMAAPSNHRFLYYEKGNNKNEKIRNPTMTRNRVYPQEEPDDDDDMTKRMSSIQERFRALPTKYYHPALQTAAFVLPLWAHQAIYGDDSEENAY
ncbi:hypothetical protein ACA910_013900 [Epithemia clementina (nom. ined.)]